MYPPGHVEFAILKSEISTAATDFLQSKQTMYLGSIGTVNEGFCCNGKEVCYLDNLNFNIQNFKVYIPNLLCSPSLWQKNQLINVSSILSINKFED